MNAPWLPPDAARPLAWWDEGSLRRLGLPLEASMAQWQAAWGLRAQTELRQRRAIDAAFACDGVWQALVDAAGEAQAWLRLEEGMAARLAGALFGLDAAGSMARGVAAACSADAVARLARSLALQPGAVASIPAAAVSPWSGAVVVDLSGDFVARLVVGGAAGRLWLQRLVPRKGPAADGAQPLAAAADALAGQPLTFSVALDGCELTLGAVQALQVGDVVRTSHALEAPARINDAAGARAFSGYMGRQGAHKAVEFVRCDQHEVAS